MGRRVRMELWLLISALTMSRALNLAEKNEDIKTVKLIHDSLKPWVEAQV